MICTDLSAMAKPRTLSDATIGLVTSVLGFNFMVRFYCEDWLVYLKVYSAAHSINCIF